MSVELDTAIHRMECWEHWIKLGTYSETQELIDARLFLARIRELEAQIERCRAANVYDGNAHRRVSKLEAALTDLEMAVSDLMREEDFEVSETLSTALDIARSALETKGDSGG